MSAPERLSRQQLVEHLAERHADHDTRWSREQTGHMDAATLRVIHADAHEAAELLKEKTMTRTER